MQLLRAVPTLFRCAFLRTLTLCKYSCTIVSKVGASTSYILSSSSYVSSAFSAIGPCREYVARLLLWHLEFLPLADCGVRLYVSTSSLVSTTPVSSKSLFDSRIVLY